MAYSPQLKIKQYKVIDEKYYHKEIIYALR